MINAMIIDAADNVVVAIEPIKKGDTVTYVCGGQTKSHCRMFPSTTSWLPGTSPRVSL